MKRVGLILLVTLFLLVGIVYYIFIQFASGFGGNIGSLYLIIETRYPTQLTEQFSDSFLTKNKKYAVPAELDNDWNYDHLGIKKFHFKDAPQEVYIVGFSSGLTDILAVKDVEKDIEYSNTRDYKKIPEKYEEERIRKRFREEILKPIEALITNSPIPDSLKHK